jgi:hypothetical protein
MKRKIFGVTLSLLIVLSLCLSTAVPAMAADPEPDNQPIGWVSLGGSNGRVKDEQGVHGRVSILVKKLSDGTTVGHFYIAGLNDKIINTLEIIDSEFHYEGEVKVANVLTHWDLGGGFIVWALFVFEDRGEPGGGTDFYRIWAINLPPDVKPPWPPTYPPSGGWFPWGSGATIVSSNLQVHIND